MWNEASDLYISVPTYTSLWPSVGPPYLPSGGGMPTLCGSRNKAVLLQEDNTGVRPMWASQSYLWQAVRRANSVRASSMYAPVPRWRLLRVGRPSGLPTEVWTAQCMRTSMCRRLPWHRAMPASTVPSDGSSQMRLRPAPWVRTMPLGAGGWLFDNPRLQ